MLSKLLRRPGVRPCTRRAITTEQLELRILPTVTATLSKGVLTLIGDGTANDLTVAPYLNGLTLTGNNGTTIRFEGNTGGQQSIEGVVSVKTIFTGRANDKIEFGAGVSLRDVTLNLGSGVNTVGLTGATITGDLAVTSFIGADTIKFDGSTVKSAKLKLGSGNNNVEFKGTTVTGSTSITTTSGVDTIKAVLGTGGELNHFQGGVSIDTDFGNDEIDLRSSSFTDLSVGSGRGNDQLSLLTLTVTGRLSLNAGENSDQITVDGVTQTGSKGARLTGGAEADTMRVKGSSFSGATTIDMASGPNHLVLDDVAFAAKTTIFSDGNGDLVDLEQDGGRTGATSFAGQLFMTLGKDGILNISKAGAASFTQTGSTFNLNGSARSVANVFLTRTGFAVSPKVKHVEWHVIG